MYSAGECWLDAASVASCVGRGHRAFWEVAASRLSAQWTRRALRRRAGNPLRIDPQAGVADRATGRTPAEATVGEAAQEPDPDCRHRRLEGEPTERLTVASL